jgi:hypothetical protein
VAPDILSIADFNRDGKVDIATIDATFTGISVLFADGPIVFLPVASGVFALRVADFNADGTADLLYSSGAMDAGPDRTIEFADTAGEDCHAIITAVAADADAPLPHLRVARPDRRARLGPA